MMDDKGDDGGAAPPSGGVGGHSPVRREAWERAEYMEPDVGTVAPGYYVLTYPDGRQERCTRAEFEDIMKATIVGILKADRERDARRKAHRR